ncbi:TetR/AcrR family transcriptional regulator [Brevibacterium casei]
MPKENAQRTRLSRADWIEAATRFGVERGFDDLAVEPLAARLGTTKGSFYWHFANRADLLDAVMETWEETATRSVIAEIADQDPDRALVSLIDIVLGSSDNDALEWKLVNSSDHPQIAPAVTRVHALRIDYLAELFQRRGLSATRANARARVLYAAYLGNLALLSDPGTSPVRNRVALRREFIAIAEAP